MFVLHYIFKRKNEMKKLLICLFTILFLTESVWALNADNFINIMKDMGKDDVSILYQGKEIARYSKQQFIESIKAQDFYSQLTKAEKLGKINVVLKDNPWTIVAGNTFTSSMDIIWIGEDGKELKKITVSITIQTDKQNQIFLVYKNLCIYLFPASVFIIIILIILLSVK
jgi:hypothetical protein